MPLPDYSKKKADLKRHSHKSENGEDHNQDQNRRRSSGMAYLLERDNNNNNDDDDVNQLEGSNASLNPDALADPFYDEEESVTENYDDDEEDAYACLSKSVNDVHVRLPDNSDRRPSAASCARMNKSFPDVSDRSHGSGGGHLGDFLDRSNRRGRHKTSLLPGSTTEDLTNEMNEVVSMLSAKRSGTTRGAASRSSSRDPQLPQNTSRRGPSHRRRSPSGEERQQQRRTPRRAQSHDGETVPTGRALPPKSKSADGTSRRIHMPSRTNSSSGESKTQKHTSSSFVTGSRIRRIQPGRSNELGASSSSLQRSVSPRRRPVRRGSAVVDNAIPALVSTK